MSAAQGHMNDKLRNHGLPTPKEADTAESMSAEERVTWIDTDAARNHHVHVDGVCHTAKTLAGAIELAIRQAEQAARAHERRKALEDVLSLIGQQSPALHRNDILRLVRALSTSSEPGGAA